MPYRPRMGAGVLQLLHYSQRLSGYSSGIPLCDSASVRTRMPFSFPSRLPPFALSRSLILSAPAIPRPLSPILPCESSFTPPTPGFFPAEKSLARGAQAAADKRASEPFPWRREKRRALRRESQSDDRAGVAHLHKLLGLVRSIAPSQRDSAWYHWPSLVALCCLSISSHH